jgi:2'-5' RNA ligase
MRLFVAVDLDDRARAAIAAEQSRLQRMLTEGSPPRWTAAEQIHLTLVFLGEIEPAVAELLQNDLAMPVPLDPFELVFAGIGVFPPRGAPRAQWVGAREGTTEQHAQQQALAATIARRGVALESRPFSPHLTIARWKRSRPSDRSRVLRRASDRTIARLRVDHTTLYHSRLSPQGSSYTELARATLTGSPHG